MISSNSTDDQQQQQSQQQQQQQSQPSSDWSPNRELLSQLTEMGISGSDARKALFQTGNSSAEVAIAWIFEHPDSSGSVRSSGQSSSSSSASASQSRTAAAPDIISGRSFAEAAAGGSSTATSTSSRTSGTGSTSAGEIYKMVFVVNADLGMGIGKTAAQVAHAALGMQQILLAAEARFGEQMIAWIEMGETKIVLRGESSGELVQLEAAATRAGLPAFLVQDAGKTQVPAGSTTVLALFGRVDRVDAITGHLRLL